MCGVVGISSALPVDDRSWLLAGRDAMVHRGPDDAGQWWSDDLKVGLGHRRLSILDLSPLGHQPMRNEAHGLTVIFNGEIYNHAELRQELLREGFAFRSRSDTEVLLAAYAAWGEDCFSRLNGMFAIALHDGLRQRVVLARDRCGEKPLFYRWEQGRLCFASELKALLANPQLPRRIDHEAIDCFLALGFVPGERCILEGYRKLQAGHLLVHDLREGGIRLKQYWALPELSAPPNTVTGEEILLNDLETLLQDAVGRQLTSDVPTGILLSGGVDSSLVTAMAVRHSQKLHTFSVGFPGHGEADETAHARLIAKHFGTIHSELMAQPPVVGQMLQLAQQFDEPIVDSSMLPTFVLSQLVRKHCTVALGGDGGDELFGGYPAYSRLLLIKRWSVMLPHWLRGTLARAAERHLPLGFAQSNVRTWLMALNDDWDAGLPQVAQYFDAAKRRDLLADIPGHRFVAEGIHRTLVATQPDILQRATRTDFSNYLTEDILVKVDRASMLNSLEIRAPFLDYRIVEFAFSRVPSRLKATANDKKILLKRLAARLLPPEFDRTRKQGFSIPLTEWLKSGPFRKLFWDTLTDPGCLFDRTTVQDLLTAQDRGLNNGERLFALVHFELWRRQYGAVL